jgi:hypothetical protein
MCVGFFGNFIIAWIGFWALSLFAVYILPWARRRDLVMSAVLLWGTAAAVFGFLDSMRTRSEANRLGAPRWRDYRVVDLVRSAKLSHLVW